MPASFSLKPEKPNIKTYVMKRLMSMISTLIKLRNSTILYELNFMKIYKYSFLYICVFGIVKPENKNHPWDQKMMVFFCRWSLFAGPFFIHDKSLF